MIYDPVFTKVLGTIKREETIQHARTNALLAERKMGELLLKKPPAYKSGPGRGKKGSVTVSQPFNENPTLKELGITGRESAEAQQLAESLRPVSPLQRMNIS